MGAASAPPTASAPFLVLVSTPLVCVVVAERPRQVWSPGLLVSGLLIRSRRGGGRLDHEGAERARSTRNAKGGAGGGSQGLKPQAESLKSAEAD
jgi:hypothetical protein